MDKIDYIYEKLQELHAMFVLCCVCKKMKANVICDNCNIPCCLLCIKNNQQCVHGGSSCRSMTNIKLCPNCYKCYTKKYIYV